MGAIVEVFVNDHVNERAAVIMGAEALVAPAEFNGLTLVSGEVDFLGDPVFGVLAVECVLGDPVECCPLAFGIDVAIGDADAVVGLDVVFLDCAEGINYEVARMAVAPDEGYAHRLVGGEFEFGSDHCVPVAGIEPAGRENVVALAVALVGIDGVGVPGSAVLFGRSRCPACGNAFIFEVLLEGEF